MAVYNEGFDEMREKHRSRGEELAQGDEDHDASKRQRTQNARN